MDRITPAQLRDLAQTRDPRCVSVFMPTHRSGRDNEQDPIRLKNLLNQAEETLSKTIRSTDAREQLEPARALLGDHDFWLHQGDGLALFITPNQLYSYRLPLTFPELVVTGERLHVAPLLPLVTHDGRFYVLSVSPTDVRLLVCSRDTATELEVPDMPRNYEELGRYIDEESQLQWHTGAQPVQQSGGHRAAMFHGHGGGADKANWKQRLGEYSQVIDRAVSRFLVEEKAPLVVACDLTMWGVYKQVNTYPQMVEEDAILGNPDETSADALRDAAWDLLEPRFGQVRQQAIDRLHEAQSKGTGSFQINEIVPAAHEGRVATLFVALDQHAWGSFDAQTRQVTVHDSEQSGDEDLLDLAVMHTFLNGGIVYMLPQDEMPGGNRIAATYRF